MIPDSETEPSENGQTESTQAAFDICERIFKSDHAVIVHKCRTHRKRTYLQALQNDSNDKTEPNAERRIPAVCICGKQYFYQREVSIDAKP